LPGLTRQSMMTIRNLNPYGLFLAATLYGLPGQAGK
jgi:hypothetical protein